MAFSFYQSLRTLPSDLDEVGRQFGLSPWQRFWRLELPFATPGLIWNTMMSMSGGWFFVVASEAITVGDTTIDAAGHRLVAGAGHRAAGHRAPSRWAVGAMAVVILLYDQLLFRPIVAWADKFRFEQTAAAEQPRSWVYDLLRRTPADPPAVAGRRPGSARRLRRIGPSRGASRAGRAAAGSDAASTSLWLAAGRCWRSALRAVADRRVRRCHRSAWSRCLDGRSASAF